MSFNPIAKLCYFSVHYVFAFVIAFVYYNIFLFQTTTKGRSKIPLICHLVIWLWVNKNTHIYTVRLTRQCITQRMPQIPIIVIIVINNQNQHNYYTVNISNDQQTFKSHLIALCVVRAFISVGQR